MTEQVKLESICPSCGKTDKLLWPEGCKNTWHIEGCGAMSEIQRYIAKTQELPKPHKTYIADEIVVRNDAHESALRERDERIAELEKALSKIDMLAESSEMLDKIPAVTAKTLRPIIRAALEAK